MTEQSPVPETEPLSRREARRHRREQRLADPSRQGSWVVGLILILLGGMFLLRTTGTWDIPLTNWWALFIFLPAFGTLSAAWRTYQQEGRLNGAARISLLVGLVLTFIAFMFLFGINWTYVGPLLIIGIGISVILSYMIGGQE
jgi:peptidoglycan/LPS O-acetylase OafA/YrhL